MGVASLSRISNRIRPLDERVRRYMNYKGGRKYDPADKHQLEKGTGDPEKAESARIFFDAWKKAEAKPAYARMKAEWTERYG